MNLCGRTLIIILFVIGLFFIITINNVVVKADTATSNVTVLLVCGDGFKDTDETCDPPDFGGLTCSDFSFEEGDLTCSNDCNEIFTNLCNTCGNGIREGYEQCDSSDFGGDSCSTYGYNSGELSCAPTCNVNIMGCSSVGLSEPGNQGTQGGGGGGGGSGGRGGGGGGVASGFSPGSDTAPKETKVVITGKAYPGSDVNILVDGKVVGIVKADPKADFYFETAAITPGIAGIGIWAEDKNGLKSTLQTVTFRVTSGAITTVSGAYLSPTIDMDKKSAAKGETLKIFGQTVPESEVLVHINSEEEIIKQVGSKDNGEWTLDFNTSPLKEEEYHTAKALFQAKASENVIKSSFSRAISFYVGAKGSAEACPNADLNKDKKVNLVDFSILLYHWGANNICADQNKNKKVDLIDFSIMLYHWTG